MRRAAGGSGISENTADRSPPNLVTASGRCDDSRVCCRDVHLTVQQYGSNHAQADLLSAALASWRTPVLVSKLAGSSIAISTRCANLVKAPPPCAARSAPFAFPNAAIIAIGSIA